MQDFEVYQRLAGTSGVKAYQINKDSIKVIFNDGDTYLYTHRKTGKSNIDQMKKLAREGKGLSTFISQNVHNLWEKKSKSKWDGSHWIELE